MLEDDLYTHIHHRL